MKILKYLLYVLLALVVIGVILGLVGPKTYEVSRSKVIAASSEQIWPYVTSFQKSKSWSPWVRMDTTMTAEYSGEEGTVGSKMTWKSKKMGGGEQTITVLEPYKLADSELKFIQPWGEGHATSSFQLADTVGGTKVTWGIKGENGFVNRAMAALMNMDKMMGPIFMQGLNNLDSVMATVPKSAAMEMKINTQEFPGGNYLAVRKEVKISKLGEFFMNNFKAVMDGAEKAKAEVAGAPAGLYYTWAPDKDLTDVACAVPVKGEVKAPAGLSVIAVPAGKAAVIEYVGGYSGVGKAHEAMDTYFKQNNLQQTAPVIEEYLVGEPAETDSTKWVTKIIYFIK